MRYGYSSERKLLEDLHRKLDRIERKVDGMIKDSLDERLARVDRGGMPSKPPPENNP